MSDLDVGVNVPIETSTDHLKEHRMSNNMLLKLPAQK